MTLVADHRVDTEFEDRPIELVPAYTPADRKFFGLLACSAAIVFMLLVAIMVFLLYHGWWALQHFNFRFFFGTEWSAPAHPGVLALIGGSVEVALVALVFAVPVSIATALMINEFAPKRLRGWLTALIDLLATVPSIVYGFWGLEAFSKWAKGPSEWMVAHLGFIPIFRTDAAGSYEGSIFIAGLVVSIMIIPVITSITREVMAQTPRDACEAALALGGTRWGMITDVVLPFSRSGMVGATLLGLSRALGETIAVLLILSSNTTFLTGHIMGPEGTTVAKEIGEAFVNSSTQGESELVLAGLTLFATTLVFSLGGRIIVSRGKGPKR
jgi:phosphate transport system permease protein